VHSVLPGFLVGRGTASSRTTIPAQFHIQKNGSIAEFVDKREDYGWPLLRKGSRVRGRSRKKLNALLVSKLATARASKLKETFHHFWTYKSPN
jgi:hypothetical protein